jgi:hypothetical protein
MNTHFIPDDKETLALRNDVDGLLLPKTQWSKAQIAHAARVGKALAQERRWTDCLIGDLRRRLADGHERDEMYRSLIEAHIETTGLDRPRLDSLKG